MVVEAPRDKIIGSARPKSTCATTKTFSGGRARAPVDTKERLHQIKVENPDNIDRKIVEQRLCQKVLSVVEMMMAIKC